MDIGQIKQKIKQNDFLRKLVLYSITSSKNPRPRYWVKWFINPWVHKKGEVLSSVGEDPALTYSLGISSR